MIKRKNEYRGIDRVLGILHKRYDTLRNRSTFASKRHCAKIKKKKKKINLKFIIKSYKKIMINFRVYICVYTLDKNTILRAFVFRNDDICI